MKRRVYLQNIECIFLDHVNVPTKSVYPVLEHKKNRVCIFRNRCRERAAEKKQGPLELHVPIIQKLCD